MERKPIGSIGFRLDLVTCGWIEIGRSIFRFLTFLKYSFVIFGQIFSWNYTLYDCGLV